MKLMLDEDIPQSAAMRLAALGYSVDPVLDEQLTVEATRAQAEDRFLVTYPLDFSDTRKFELTFFARRRSQNRSSPAGIDIINRADGVTFAEVIADGESHDLEGVADEIARRPLNDSTDCPVAYACGPVCYFASPGR